MQGIDRRVEISVFLLQPCELDFEFALIFVGHGVRQLKNAMRLRKGRRKRPEANILLASLPRKLRGSMRSHSTYEMKYDRSIFDIHRQILRLVYNSLVRIEIDSTEEVSYGD
jgi:hypothetical protein